MYADDPTLSVSGSYITWIERKLMADMVEIIKWINKNKLALNVIPKPNICYYKK